MASRYSLFGYVQTGYSADQIPDLTGKVAIVTGGNTGLGFETVLQLASKGARVFMASRSEPRARAALEKLQGAIGAKAAARVEVLPLDLQDLRQTQQAARDFLARGLPLHILVNNAGIMACPFARTRDGIESQMGTNHVGHFALTLGLLPALERGAPSRVVNVSSNAYQWAPKGGLHLDKVADEAAMSAWERYGQSKLANILFTLGFDKRFGERGIFANSLHPGVVSTELIRGPVATLGPLRAPLFRVFAWFMMMDVKQGALTQIYVATSPDFTERNIKAKYFEPFAHMEDPKREEASDPVLVEELWEWTDKIVREATAN